MSEPQIVDEPEHITMVVRGKSVPMSELTSFFDSSFGKLAAVIGAQGVQPLSAAFALYHGAPSDVADLEVGFVTSEPIEPTGDVVVSSLPSGQVLRTVHNGSFDGLGPAWGDLFGYATSRGLTPSDQMWEVYLTEPSPDMDPAELRTELNLLLG